MHATRMTIALLACLTLTACGMAKAARQSAQTFDQYGCLAREFKGQPPCKPGDEAAPTP